MPRNCNFFVQFGARTSTHTSMPEVFGAKISGSKDEHRKAYICEEKHPIHLDCTMNGPNTLTLHKLLRGCWKHRRSLCMKINDCDGDSYAPMIMEFEETKLDENPSSYNSQARMMHLVRMTGWPEYMREVMQQPTKCYKDTQTGKWVVYRTDLDDWSHSSHNWANWNRGDK